MPGLYFEDLTVGKQFKHPIRRTVTEADNVFICALTHNPAALHLDEQYCREHTEFGQRQPWLGRGQVSKTGVPRRYHPGRKRSA